MCFIVEYCFVFLDHISTKFFFRFLKLIGKCVGCQSIFVTLEPFRELIPINTFGSDHIQITEMRACSLAAPGLPNILKTKSYIQGINHPRVSLREAGCWWKSKPSYFQQFRSFYFDYIYNNNNINYCCVKYF